MHIVLSIDPGKVRHRTVKIKAKIEVMPAREAHNNVTKL